MKPFFYLFLLVVIIFSACNNQGVKKQAIAEKATTIDNKVIAEMPLNTVNPPIITGSIDRLSDKLDLIIPKTSQLEIIAEGFIWSEGPVWLPIQNKLLFCDIPRNSIFQWSEDDGLSVYLDSAGYPGIGTGVDELMGSNGLLLNSEGELVMCQHGYRQIAKMKASLDNPESKFESLVATFEGKKLNSPNDAVYNSKGDLYFTDPPYGLPGQSDGPTKELDFQGVYKLSSAGELTLLTDKLYRPNGIGLSPDEKTLYVANSDPEHPLWMAYTLNEDGLITNERLLFDAGEYAKQRPDLGLPDGLVVDKKGNVFGTGPGGVYVFSPEGELLGFINTGHTNGNCTFDADESTLYITADMYLMRLKL